MCNSYRVHVVNSYVLVILKAIKKKNKQKNYALFIIVRMEGEKIIVSVLGCFVWFPKHTPRRGAGSTLRETQHNNLGQGFPITVPWTRIMGQFRDQN